MRTIKFRGKTELTGEWVYGFFTMGSFVRFEHPKQDERVVPRYLIYDGLLHDVIPETVGQFTGLFDKNGKEIYEGDIVRHDENSKCYSIIYEEPMFRFAPNDDCFAFLNHPELLEVIGNIHDDKKLLEKGGEQ